MDRAWKHYTSTPAPATAAPVAAPKGTQYGGDYVTLVAIFRTEIETLNKHRAPRVRFADQLRHLALLMLDGWGSPDAQFTQQCFDDHGPEILLLALAKACAEPSHVLGDLEGD